MTKTDWKKGRLRRLVSLLLILDMLINGFAVPGGAWAAPEMDPAVSEVGTFELGEATDGPEAAVGENVYTFPMGDRTEALLSEILEAVRLELPIGDIELIGQYGAEAETDAPVSIEPLEDDYRIRALRDFDEAAIAIDTEDDHFTLLLTDAVVTPAGEVEDFELDVVTEDAPEEVGYAYRMGDVKRARLSDILAAAGAEDVGPIELAGLADDGDADALIIEPDGDDYRLTAAKDFDEVRLNVFAGGGMVSLLLLDGIAPAPEATAVPGPTEVPAEENIEETAEEPATEDEIEYAVEELEYDDELIVIGPDPAFAPLMGDAEQPARAKAAARPRSSASYDTAALRLSLSGSENATATLRPTSVEVPAWQQVVEAYEIVSSADCDGINATLIDMPALEEGEWLALYGVRGGALSEDPVADHIDVGSGHTFLVDLWDGFALVRLGLSEYQTLAPVAAGDALIELTGALPVAASVEAQPVEGYDDGDGRTLLACDITIQDGGGNTFQPAAGEAVEVTVRSDAIREALERGSALEAWHYADGAADPEPVEILAAAGDAVTFAARAFSVYVIRAHEDGEVEVPRVAFHFIDAEATQGEGGVYVAGPYRFINTSKGGDRQDSQILRDGETLEMIANPKNRVISEDKTEYFFGWYVVEHRGDADGKIQYAWTASPAHVDFGVPIAIEEQANGDYAWSMGGASGSGAPDDEGLLHVYVAPMYEDYLFANFHFGPKERVGTAEEPDIGANLYARTLLVMGSDHEAEVEIGAFEAPSPDPKSRVFSGWETVDGDMATAQTYLTRTGKGDKISTPGRDGYYITYPEYTNGAKNGDLELYPTYYNVRWAGFDVGENTGATYVGSEYLLIDERQTQTTTADDLDVYFKTALKTSRRNGYDFAGWYYLDGDERVFVTDENGRVLNEDKSVAGEWKIVKDTSDANAPGRLYFLKANTDEVQDVTFHAAWEEILDTKYSVIVWKQKVTDDKYAAASEKTYDYYSSATGISARSTMTLDDLDLTRYTSLGGDDFKGFHYSAVKMTAEKLDGEGRTVIAETEKVTGDGTTVVNVYYDRDLMTINFINYPGGGTIYSYTSTTATSGTLYGLVDNQYVLLTRGGAINSTTVEYYLSQYDVDYGYNYRYTGTVYSDKNGTIAASPIYPNTYYRKNQYNQGNYYSLYWYSRTVTTTTYPWIYSTSSGEKEEYTGTRYTRSSSTGLQWTGLYEQTFEQNDYDWSSVSSYVWNEKNDGSGLTQTMLYSFNQTSNPYYLYYRGSNGASTINHYRQKLDGTFSESDKSTAKTTSTSTNFTFGNKFTGFTVEYYSTKNEGFLTNGGTHRIEAGTTVNSLSLPFYVYHTRDKNDFIFDVNYPTQTGVTIGGVDITSSAADQYKDVNQTESVAFEAPLSAYADAYRSSKSSDHFPVAPDNYRFVGWYEDETGTQEYKFDDTMPAAKKVVYAKWEPIKLQVI
ncbi:MAG: InlB B-repeat-containing protein, partial [Clostridia bacterium]|nr:InlB B-repeat-containing protein [Clostridia bacterium]